MKSPLSLSSWSYVCRARFAPAGLGLLLAAGAVTAKDKPAAPAAPAARTNAPAPVVELVIPQSVFNSNPQAGRNPFFPHSAIDPKRPDKAPISSRFPEGVRLGGISGFPARPLAIINDVTFASGETGEIKIDGRRVLVRVVSVKETSVIMTINGITEEKSLRKEL